MVFCSLLCWNAVIDMQEESRRTSAVIYKKAIINYLEFASSHALLQFKALMTFLFLDMAFSFLDFFFLLSDKYF